jgi:hypothetical protein
MRNFPFGLFLKEFGVILVFFLGIRLVVFYWNSPETLTWIEFSQGMLPFGLVISAVLAFVRVLKTTNKVD